MFLSLKSLSEMRYIMVNGEQHNYQISDELYIKQLGKFFSGENVYPFQWFSGLYRKIIDFRDSKLCQS